MDTIARKVAENFGGESNHLVPEANQFSLDQVPNLTGKVAVVTGGSEGIGYGCAHTLLAHDISKLFLLSMSSDVKDRGIAALRDDLGDAAIQKIVWKQCDLADWTQTGTTALEIARETDRLDILINNAGRGVMSRQLAPTNGVELTMATNHVGHAVLTSHLLPLLKKTAEAGNVVRVVNLSSNVHESAPPETQFASVAELNEDYNPNKLYGRSKLATLLDAKYLATHLSATHPRILVNATHPGFVDTRQSTEHILEAYPIAGHLMKEGIAPFKKDVFEGCVSTMFAATVTEGTGQYICPPAIVEKGGEKANDLQLAERLMRLTREVVEEKTRGESREKGCPFKDY
ncbi:NAD(P)-binding protein [Eremomyces bilateralis CBS 781.70]|uniref:NAD(P)-binding protein n=1 Tax=Eremomyces bilateralis CBS 781.70 TaxID=1392243 RepID=A0A6G1GAL0_9PEZI|nr:NAD(P)-binding protein [Eremomyces bilateralis CBS 781.70]KAF1814976.1 NAD(P)-binding protein [Eremomyces bilateralis CBS 781.70]